MSRVLDHWLSGPLATASHVFAACGAGVQSTVMLIMGARGEFGRAPDEAIIADTQREVSAVYEQISFLRSPNVALPFPLTTVTKGDLGQDVFDAASQAASAQALRVANPPFFTRGPREEALLRVAPELPLFGIGPEKVEVVITHSSESETFGMLRRSCTDEYKIRPINRAVRARLGLSPGERWRGEPAAELWIGLTTDELERVTYSGSPAIRHRWPLIEAGMSRNDCVLWLKRNGFPVPVKSRCYFCPFQSNELWRDLRDNAPVDWARAVELDHSIRDGIRGTRHKLYLHESRTPLDTVNLDQPSGLWTSRALAAECLGACGL